jgi:DNA polymerase-3 subunit epsilon
MPGPGFAVIDFETTGLFPGGHDRVIEVAIVHVDPAGRIGERWDTLVNPGRDLGPQRIHRIRTSEILAAPTFAQIAPQIVSLLSGRVVVAHNASFDLRFLLAELERAGYDGWFTLESLCTMHLARDFLPGAGRSLEDCCAALDIDLEGAHRASVDAFATAQLLESYILHNPMWDGWAPQLQRASAPWPIWPEPEGRGVKWCPRGTEPAEPRSFLERITIKLPEHSGPAEHLDYLALLDRCLLDRTLSVHERDSLVSLAETMGISRTTCVRLHAEYFDDLIAVAWSDGVLSTDEIADIVSVAALLDIGDAVVSAAMQPREVQEKVERHGFALQQGDLIVLTGEMRRPRDEWHTELLERGYVPWAAITKKVRLLAAADPDSLSGKARKARDYDIVVVDEDGLARLIGSSSIG